MTQYDFAAVGQQFVYKAANYTANRYRTWNIDTEDVAQEIFMWLYEPRNTARVERWLSSDPQQTTRIYRSMLDVALKYAEIEKATKVGYLLDDVYWYSPSAVEGLMPLVLDSTYVEDDGAMSERISMLVDIRRVMTVEDRAFFLLNDNTHPNWTEEIQNIVNKLGGERPYVGRRRPMSNSRAQAITGEAYNGE